MGKRHRTLVEKIEELLEVIEKLPVAPYELIYDKVDVFNSPIRNSRRGETDPNILPTDPDMPGGFALAAARGHRITGTGILLRENYRERLIWWLRTIVAGKKGKRGPPQLDEYEKLRKALLDVMMFREIEAAIGEKRGAKTRAYEAFANKFGVTERQARDRIKTARKTLGRK